MKRLTLLSAAAAPGVALALCLCLARSAPAAGAPGQPIRVAVVNVPRIFLELQETKDIEDRFKQERNRLASEEAPMMNQLKDLDAEGRNYRPGSPQYEDWRQRFTKARVNHNAWVEVAKADNDWRRKKMIRELYDKIYAAVGDYATANQIDLVLADHQPTMSDKDMEQIQPDNLPTILNQRRIVYVSKNADISDAVIAGLDAKYKAGGGPGVGVPVPTGITGGSPGQGTGPGTGPGTANADTAGANLRGQGQPTGQLPAQGPPQRRPNR